MGKKRKRIEFSAWGTGAIKFGAPSCAYMSIDETGLSTPVSAVCQALERHWGAGLVCATCRSDGMSLSNGKPDSYHYEITIGRAARGGGHNVEGRLWIAIPVNL